MPLTGKARSPTVDSRDVGTAKVSEDHDRNRCLDVSFLTVCSSVDKCAAARPTTTATPIHKPVSRTLWVFWYQNIKPLCILLQQPMMKRAHGDKRNSMFKSTPSSSQITAVCNQHSICFTFLSPNQRCWSTEDIKINISISITWKCTTVWLNGPWNIDIHCSSP